MTTSSSLSCGNNVCRAGSPKVTSRYSRLSTTANAKRLDVASTVSAVSAPCRFPWSTRSPLIRAIWPLPPRVQKQSHYGGSPAFRGAVYACGTHEPPFAQLRRRPRVRRGRPSRARCVERGRDAGGRGMPSRGRTRG